jgi:hypothetical protein
MTETPRAIAEKATQQAQHDDEEHQQVERPNTERPHEDATLHMARRRASLKKEIRAGWQRALGH